MKLTGTKQVHSMCLPSRGSDVGHDFIGVSKYLFMQYTVGVIRTANRAVSASENDDGGGGACILFSPFHPRLPPTCLSLLIHQTGQYGHFVKRLNSRS